MYILRIENSYVDKTLKIQSERHIICFIFLINQHRCTFQLKDYSKYFKLKIYRPSRFAPNQKRAVRNCADFSNDELPNFTMLINASVPYIYCSDKQPMY